MRPSDRCSLAFQYLPSLYREMTREAKSSLRRKRLKRRMSKRCEYSHLVARGEGGRGHR